MNFVQFFEKLSQFSLECNEANNHLFFSYSGHVKTVDVRFFKGGWIADQDPDFSVTIPFQMDYAGYYALIDYACK